MVNMIDELGALNQEIARLEETARQIKKALIAQGVGKYNGLDFVADVQHYDRATIDPALVRKFANEDFVGKVTVIKPVDAVVVKRVAV